MSGAAQLFKRSYLLTVATIPVGAERSSTVLTIEDLDITFKVVRTLTKEPNTAEIEIFNLHPDKRAQLQERKAVRVRLEAGYAVPPGAPETAYSTRSLIFEGDLREVRSHREGPNVITTIASGDGETAHRRSRINMSFPPGVGVRKLIEEAAKKLGIGKGNLDKFFGYSFPSVGDRYHGGTVLSGNTMDELERVVRSADAEVSIQNGALQILKRREALDTEGIVMSAATGMVESPSLSSDGTLKVKSLMIPDLFPGRKIKMEAESVQGVFRAEKCTYSGDTTTPEWYVNTEAREPGKPKPKTKKKG